jgi:hypothetical protein
VIGTIARMVMDVKVINNFLVNIYFRTPNSNKKGMTFNKIKRFLMKIIKTPFKPI